MGSSKRGVAPKEEMMNLKQCWDLHGFKSEKCTLIEEKMLEKMESSLVVSEHQEELLRARNMVLSGLPKPYYRNLNRGKHKMIKTRPRAFEDIV